MNVGNVILGRRQSPGGVQLVPRDRGMCDTFVELDEDRRFSIKLEETFDVHMVRNNDNSFFRN